MTKVCTRCKVERPLADYNVDRRYRDGHGTYCKPCLKVYRRQRYEANRDRQLAQNAAWKAENPERYDSIRQEWIERNPDRVAEYQRAYRERHAARRRRSAREHRRRLVGFTPELVAELLTAQGNACAICRVAIAEETAHADHDHATGQPRGLLCLFCNHGLGRFRDDERLLASAIEYLNHHRKGARP